MQVPSLRIRTGATHTLACSLTSALRKTFKYQTVMSDKASGGYNWDKWEGEQKMVSPSAERNKQLILEELSKYLPTSGLVLEVASGTGQHITHFAAALSRDLQWQPSDVTGDMFGSIQAYISEQGLCNVRMPVVLDASQSPQQWPVQGPFSAVIAANLTHISPWLVTQGLVAGAGELLQSGGILFIYGPFKVDGQFTTDSNRQFHETLVAQNPQWGYRDVADIAAAAAAAGLKHEQTVAMPANNFALVFRNDVGR